MQRGAANFTYTVHCSTLLVTQPPSSTEVKEKVEVHLYYLHCSLFYTFGHPGPSSTEVKEKVDVHPYYLHCSLFYTFGHPAPSSTEVKERVEVHLY